MIAAKRLNDHFTPKILSTQAIIFEKTVVNLSKRKLETSIQSKFLTNSVVSNVNTNKTQILKETIASAVLTEKELPISITRKHDKNLPMSVPAKTCRSNTPPEISTCANNLLDITGHQVRLQNTAALPFWQFKRSQVGKLIYKPLTDSRINFKAIQL